MRSRTPVTIAVGTASLVIAALGGVLLGLGVFTFEYARGASYLSSDPKACANCHIMWPQYLSWERSSHHAVAGCADCHLPRHGIQKWIAKAENGYLHSRAFTLQNFHEPIQITPKNSAILQTNCLDCHGDLTHDAGAGGWADLRCVHCHSTVGHGERAAVGGPLRDDEYGSEVVDVRE